MLSNSDRIFFLKWEVGPRRPWLAPDLRFGIWDLESGIWDLGSGFWDLGSEIWDLGFGIISVIVAVAVAVALDRGEAMRSILFVFVGKRFEAVRNGLRICCNWCMCRFFWLFRFSGFPGFSGFPVRKRFVAVCEVYLANLWTTVFQVRPGPLW